MQTYAFHYFPSYTAGPDAYDRLGEVCLQFGKTAVVVGGHRAMAAAKVELDAAAEKAGIQILEYIWYGGEASLENAQMIADNKSFQVADMCFAVGGGKALDTGKYAARLIANKPVFSFPTIAATCAPSSAESIMYYPSGEARDTYQLGRPAEHIFINTKIIAEAPDLYLWAGIGDTMAKHFETSSSAKGKNLTFKQALGVELGVMCYKPLVEFGAQAIEDCKNNIASEAFEQIVLTNIITTGAVSGMVGGTINTSIAHSLCYGLTVLPQVEKNHLHGEIVSYGVLVLLMVEGKEDMVDVLWPLYKAIHLPTKYSELDVNREDLDAVIEKTLSTEDITFVPYKVTKEMLMAGIEKLEEYNARH